VVDFAGKVNYLKRLSWSGLPDGKVLCFACTKMRELVLLALSLPLAETPYQGCATRRDSKGCWLTCWFVLVKL